MISSARLELGTHPDFPECRVFFSTEAQFGWVEPKPTTEILERFYRSEYRKVRREAPTRKYVIFMARRAEVQRRFIVKHGVVNRFDGMLDIGCGAGQLLKVFAGHAKRLVGFETDETMSAFAATELGAAATIHQTHFDPAHAPTSQFTLITLSHVLEHITEPEEFLTGLRAWLKPGGLVFIEVPNDPLPCVRHQVTKQVRGLAHVYFFTPSALAAAATKAGFRVEKIATYGKRARQLSDDETEREHPLRDAFQAWSRFVRRKCDLGAATVRDLTSPLRTETPTDGPHIRMLLRLPTASA